MRKEDKNLEDRLLNVAAILSDAAKELQQMVSEERDRRKDGQNKGD